MKRPSEMNGARNEKEEQGQRKIPGTGENTKKEEAAARSCRCFIAGGFVVLTDTREGMRERGRSKTGGARVTLIYH